MSLDEIVSVTVSLEGGGVSQQGFGIPLILSSTAAWAERTRSYASLSEVAVDFIAGTAEHRAATKIFGQSPSVEGVVIGRRALKPTQAWEITVVAAVEGAIYQFEMNGTVVASYEAEAGDDESDIATGLQTDFVFAGYAATVLGAVVTVTAAAPGTWAGIQLLDSDGEPGAYALNLMAIRPSHADPGVATDLDAILLENDTWYGICDPHPSEATISAVATWAQANKRFYMALIQASEAATEILGNGDAADDLKTSGFSCAAGIYHPSNESFADAAYLGRCLPLPPGSETWNGKELLGVPTVTLTGTHKTNLKAKRCNYYRDIGGTGRTANGMVPSGTFRFIDVVRGLHWWEAGTKVRIVNYLQGADKRPFTDDGIVGVKGQVRAQNKEGIEQGLIAEDPEPTVTAPRARDVSQANKQDRHLPDVETTFTLQGAIHSVDVQATVEF